jgi:ADP-heptose:LPS heptosyltransferase/predicted SAM-dependent methyltransferase
MVWKADGPAGDEAGKIKWEIVPYTRGRGLDLGCGPYKAFPHFRGIDSNVDARLFGIQATSADFIIPTCEVLDDFASCSQDFVFSSHLLEHIVEWQNALAEWWRVLKQGGYLVLYLPDEDEYPKVGEKGANPDHKWNVSYDKLVKAMESIGGWDLVDFQKRNGGDEYSLYFVFKKFSDGKIHRHSWREPKPTKTCAIVRYGAWGDAVQATSLLPGLKEAGYHVTFFTTPRGHEAIKHEPLIDRFVIQDQDQVPNHELGPYWDYHAKKYDRWINLSESVEGSLLALPDRIESRWPKAVRHQVMNFNYLQFTHQIAEVPYSRPKMRFVASDAEKEWVKKEYKKLAAAPLVMWVIRGSSLHKVWNGGFDKENNATGFDGVLARILHQWPNAKVVTVGDQWCKDKIEPVWANEKRIIRRSAVWSIRETMAMAQMCDMVIGPETGVMSAVAMEPMRKVVFLSHSSHKNLTEGWVNTASLEPVNTECWPCHKLVYQWKDCVQDGDTGIAKCQASITPAMVWDAIRETLDQQEAA